MNPTATRRQHIQYEQQELKMIAAVAPSLERSSVVEHKPARVFDNTRPGAEWWAVYVWLDPEKQS